MIRLCNYDYYINDVVTLSLRKKKFNDKIKNSYILYFNTHILLNCSLYDLIFNQVKRNQNHIL